MDNRLKGLNPKVFRRVVSFTLHFVTTMSFYMVVMVLQRHFAPLFPAGTLKNMGLIIGIFLVIYCIFSKEDRKKFNDDEIGVFSRQKLSIFARFISSLGGSILVYWSLH